VAPVEIGTVVTGMDITTPYRTNSMIRMMIGIGIPRNQSKIPLPIENLPSGMLTFE
jgi:hypothetical protein